ncbi:hypothetical protein L6R52_14400, partial [Myxococcota bacterium]|nr:hypothetical protein [Myxococcota bacterium]
MSRTSRTNAPLLRATLALFAGLSVILSHGTGRAAAPSGPGEAVDRWLQRAALARGDAYATLLGELDALSPDARAVLASRAAGLGYTHATWRDDALVAITHVRVTRPDLVRRFEALDDLRPARYLAKRRPEPEAGRALARLPA